MAIRIGRSAEADRYAPGGRNYRGPIFGQQQPQLFMSIPTGGFMGQNQIGGQSAINVFRTPPPPSPSKAGFGQSPLRPPGATFGQSPLRPPGAVSRLGESSFKDRAEKYQRDVGEFNLGQKEAELKKRQAEADEIASGRFTIDGQAVTRAEMDQYQRNLERSSRNNPLMQDAQYMAAKASMPQAPQRDQFVSDESYQTAISDYLSNRRAQQQRFTQNLNNSRRNALINSINRFRNDPIGYLLGGGQGASTYSPDQLLSYLGQANQLFRATGQQGDFMDFILGGSSTSQGNVPSQSLQNLANLQAFNARDLAEREEEKRKSREQRRANQSSNRIQPKTPFVIADAPIAPQTPQSTGISRKDAIALRNKFLSDQRTRSTNDYVFRNLTPSERADPNFNSTARIKARRENDKERREAEKAFNALKLNY